jgi:hypothetical protein
VRNKANWVIALTIIGGLLLVAAAFALFGPVTTSYGDCGSLAAPGNSDEMRTGQACDAERSDRATILAWTGPTGLLFLAGALGMARVPPRKRSAQV